MKRVFSTFLALPLGCVAPPSSPPADAATAEVADPPDAPLTPAAVHAHHTGMFMAVLGYLDEPGRIVGGDWVGDYGDAAFYGPGFDLRWWGETGASSYLGRANQALAWNKTQVEAAVEDGSLLMSGMEGLAMSILGLLEAAERTGDPSLLEPADALIAVIDDVSQALGDYLQIDAGQFAASTYGPTSITGFVALVHLQRAGTASGEARTAHLERASEVLAAIQARAWDAGLGAYRFAPDNPALYLYPNILTMIACGRMYELTSEPSWLAQAETIYQGIQPLKIDDHYRSPYSAASMGATDPDYATLSSQNYLMLGLLLLYRGTANVAYLAELDGVLGFLETNLLQEGRILHHWMDGAAAKPEHKAYYCSGCNLQTLYLMTLLLE
jgi:uncharacterized protein YyaL (SSP411 family)